MGKRGKPKEKETTLKFRVTDELKERLKKYAQQKGITMTEAVEDFIKGLPID